MDRLQLHHYLADLAEPPSSPLYPLLAALFVVLLAVSFYGVALDAAGRWPATTRSARLRRALGPTIASAGLGLLGVAGAYATAPFLSKRVWLVLALAALAVTAVRLRARP